MSDAPEPIDRDGNHADNATSTTPSESEVKIEPEVTAETKELRVEEFKINGDALVAKVRELIHEGNIRRIIVKNDEGQILIEIPLTIGVVGGAIAATLFPVIAALGAIGALVAHLTIAIEKEV